MCDRVVMALKSAAILNESVGLGYIERHWPPAFQESGAWPLASLRQSFLNGSLTRLLDPDRVLREKIVEFVSKGDFGLASGRKTGGGYNRVFFNETIDPADVTFESDVLLLLKDTAKALLFKPELPHDGVTDSSPIPDPSADFQPGQPDLQTEHGPPAPAASRTFHIHGDVPQEMWNRFGTKILPKLRNRSDVKIGIDFSVTVDSHQASNFESELNQILSDLSLADNIKVE